MRSVGLLQLWLSLCGLTAGDADVCCVFMESCVLPCSFQADSNVVIQWRTLQPRELLVHSYFFDRDQLNQQDVRFRGRTALRADEVPAGNASILLTEVQVQDEAVYNCYTGTARNHQESRVRVQVDAPVRHVNIRQVAGRITCSSEGIYPKPDLTWSLSPPSESVPRSTTILRRSEQLLYNISSSLLASSGDASLGYTCTVSTRSNNKTSTFHQRRGAWTPVGRVIAVVLVAASVCFLPCIYQKLKKALSFHRAVGCEAVLTLSHQKRETN